MVKLEITISASGIFIIHFIIKPHGSFPEEYSRISSISLKFALKESVPWIILNDLPSIITCVFIANDKWLKNRKIKIPTANMKKRVHVINPIIVRFLMLSLFK